MKDFMWTILSVLAAFVLTSIFSKISFSLFYLFNFFSLVVIYFALEKGEIYGACLGAFCGLVQDSFSLGVFGVAGIAKTVLGYSAGFFSSKVNVVPFRRNFVFILVLISAELIIWSCLGSFIFSERVYTGNVLIFFQPLGTAAFGSVLYHYLRKPKRLET
jgi:rod shape-determining protein MreD